MPFQHPSLTFAFLLLGFFFLSLPPPIHSIRGSDSEHPGRGINCYGSSQCSFTTSNSRNTMEDFNTTAFIGGNASPLPGGPIVNHEIFFPNEHILCIENNVHLVGSVCLFLQGRNAPSKGVPGYIIKQRINDLLYHGCKFCGSVPLLGNNRAMDAGVLTSNYVTDKSCQGVCDQGRTRYFTTKATWTVTVDDGSNERNVSLEIPW
ncbi:MAG: hypothetical protein Q9219_000192 [cf. Caloplaca sp. 3 TL-2023]